MYQHDGVSSRTLRGSGQPQNALLEGTCAGDNGSSALVLFAVLEEVSIFMPLASNARGHGLSQSPCVGRGQSHPGTGGRNEPKGNLSEKPEFTKDLPMSTGRTSSPGLKDLQFRPHNGDKEWKSRFCYHTTWARAVIMTAYIVG